MSTYTVSKVKFVMRNTAATKEPIQGFVEVAVDRVWVEITGKDGKTKTVPKDANTINLPITATPYTIECKDTNYGIDVSIDVGLIVNDLADLFDQATTDQKRRGKGKNGWWAMSDQLYHRGFKFMVWAYEDGSSLIQADPARLPACLRPC